MENMNPILRNILAVVIGIIVGTVINMGIIGISGAIIPPPEGADVTTPEGLKRAMELFTPKHFIMPFLAHALGTFAGAFVAASIAKKNKIWFALGIGAWFLLGGIAMVMMVPSPIWFTALDLIGAYIPMAYLAKIIATKE